MDANDLKNKLRELHAQLAHTGQVDTELKQLLQTLDQDIQVLMQAEPGAPSNASETEGLAERAQAISAQFAAQHPRLERVLRELAAILERMGI